MYCRTQNYGMTVILACYSCPIYLLFQNAVYLSLWKRVIMTHACSMHVIHFTNGWLDATVKGEFVCNFTGGYADKNSLSKLKVIIWTVKKTSAILNYLFVARGQMKCFGKVSAFHTSTRSLRKRQGIKRFNVLSKKKKY